jgi:hypothetical protein
VEYVVSNPEDHYVTGNFCDRRPDNPVMAAMPEVQKYDVSGRVVNGNGPDDWAAPHIPLLVDCLLNTLEDQDQLL